MQTSQYHIFTLPPELLDSLTPRHLVNRPPSRPLTPEPAPVARSGARACNVCQGIVFLSVDDQRSHYRSDWHRYNVKTRLSGGQAVSEGMFAQLLDKLEESLSGSASSDDDDEESDTIGNLVNKTNRLATRSPSPELSSYKLPASPFAWFHSPPSTQIGFYRALLPLKVEPARYLDELHKIQTRVPNGRMWAMFMVAGGHFAGAIVRVSRAEDEVEENQSGRKAKHKKPKPETEVLLHKTFHRYTTRRKQGGSQSTNDNAKGPAKSAGALLRRYGEQALRDDIRGLLETWREDIAQCQRIWIRASASNRRIFYDYEIAPWAKNDIRLRTFPFPTRRPTQSELVRCLMELTHPKVSHFTEEELHVQDEAYFASLPKPKPVPSVNQRGPEKEKQPKQPTLSKEEEVRREKWSRLLDMVTKGRLDALKTFLARESAVLGGVDMAVPDWTGFRHTTILQIAVAHGHEDVVQWLLEEARADPTIPLPTQRTTDGDGVGDGNSNVMTTNFDLAEASRGPLRTAYDLAKTKAIRDVFRRAAAAHTDWWDWFGAGHVPSALSQAMEDEQEEKKKVRRKGLRDRIKERQAKTDEKPEELPTVNEESVVSSSLSQRLGGASGAADSVIGLTPEMRAKVERERRARAAEARLMRVKVNLDNPN